MVIGNDCYGVMLRLTSIFENASFESYAQYCDKRSTEIN